jgi:dihydropteroate synthase
MNNANYNKLIAFNGHLIDTSSPTIMAIINVTPDSFFENSRANNEESILKSAKYAIENGASILDIGGYSTRPGADIVTEEEEIERVRFALNIIRSNFPNIPLSIDTFRGNVARMAVKEFEVGIINDVSGFEWDENMLDAIIELQVPYILMHSKGDPQTMQSMTKYDDFLSDILRYFAKNIAILREKGFNKEIIIDPGFGFAKTIEQNYTLLRELSVFECFRAPILVGVSRKSMIYKALDCDATEALNGTTVLNSFAIERGANILRVHDVREAAECIKLYNLLGKQNNENHISTTRNCMGR